MGREREALRWISHNRTGWGLLVSHVQDSVAAGGQEGQSLKMNGVSSARLSPVPGSKEKEGSEQDDRAGRAPSLQGGERSG